MESAPVGYSQMAVHRDHVEEVGDAAVSTLLGRNFYRDAEEKLIIPNEFKRTYLNTFDKEGNLNALTEKVRVLFSDLSDYLNEPEVQDLEKAYKDVLKLSLQTEFCSKVEEVVKNWKVICEEEDKTATFGENLESLLHRIKEISHILD